MATDEQLTVREHMVLDFAKIRWRSLGVREATIRDLFGVSATRYFQTLNALLDNPAALAAQPQLVNRLRRLRQARSEARRASA